MFTGFETTLIEEYPGLSERKGTLGIDNSTCLFWCVKRIWKTVRISPPPLFVFFERNNDKCLISYSHWLWYVSFIYLLLQHLWTFKPIYMRCVIHHYVLLFGKMTQFDLGWLPVWIYHFNYYVISHCVFYFSYERVHCLLS